MSEAHQLSRLAPAAFLLIAVGFAQTPTGTIQGLVTDPSGAAVPGAKVTIQNVATNETKLITSEPSGRFVQPFLLPGNYTVTVEANGFRTARQTDLKLDVGQSRTADFVLAVAGNNTTIEVVANTPPLDINSSMVGQVLENKRIDDLPLNGRDVFQLVNLAPNVNPTGGSNGFFGVQGQTGGIGGATSARSEVQIDGVSNTAPQNSSYPTILYEPIVDSVQEFSVQTSTPAAEYGHTAGGVVNVATKSGTNRLHGSAYYFRRDSALDANGFFSNKFNQPKPAFERTQYGGSLGGPVYIPKVYNGKDKTFFFFGYEYTSLPSGSLRVTSVPLPQWKKGDFSTGGAPLIFDPNSALPDPNNAGQWVRAQFPGNKIPATQLNPVALNVLNYYPDPNLGDANQAYNNFAANTTTPTTSGRFDSRIDHNFSSKWRTFGRVSRAQTDIAGTNLFGNDATPAGPTQVRGYNVGLDNTITVTPTLIANIRYGASRMVVLQNDVPSFDPAKLGLPQSYSDATARDNLQFPYFEFDGAFSGQSFGAGGWSHFALQPYSHNVAGNITKILNRHTIKAGGEFRKFYLNMYQPGEPGGAFWMDQGWTQQNTAAYNGTGLAYASFLTGGYGWAAMSHDPHTTMSSAYLAGFVQDDFKVSSKLTLNIGLRYDFETPRTDRYDQLEHFDPDIASPLAGKVPSSPDCPACSNLRGADVFVNTPENKYGRHQVPGPIGKTNFGPRFGFAYQLERNTVLRGGYGLMYSVSTFTAAGAASDPGTDGFYSLDMPSASWDNGKTMHATISNPFPDGYNFPLGTAGGTSTNLGTQIKSYMANPTRLPYSQQWNLNIQRQLPGAITVEVGYLGNRGMFLEGQRLNLNQLPASYMSMGNQLLEQVPNPFYGVITTPGTSWGTSPTMQRYLLMMPFPQYNGVLSNSIADAYTSVYHGMSIRADKRFSQGLSLQLAFTAGKLMSDIEASPYAGGSTGPMDMYNRRLDWCVNPEDVSRRLVVGYVYELPFGKGRKVFPNAPRGVNLLVSGWQANGIVTWQTGNPLIISGANQTTGIGNDTNRLNSLGKAGVAQPTIDAWFNTRAFAQPANFTFGNLSPTLPDVRGPGLSNWDMSFFKNNYIGGERRFNVQYRLEMFNAFNHAEFANPDTNFLSSGFGQITATAHNPREIQMALKFIF
jgi:hypothetical protein